MGAPVYEPTWLVGQRAWIRDGSRGRRGQLMCLVNDVDAFRLRGPRFRVTMSLVPSSCSEVK